ncbi:sensor histidine kinase [Ammonicoccus fulvus]|uniref:Sensor histidine kinase n=1 Tax=Ammonicoccus fulvus TaxID=3138240 RepID=A0ABZ3FRI0_9ACTN
MTTQANLEAPGFNPGAVGLSWWRRALAQGAGYFLPSSLFVFVPLMFADNYTPLTWVLAPLAATLILAFFLGTTLVMHWREEYRWLWLLGLMGSILLMGAVTGGDSRPTYFTGFVTATAATLITWRHARIVVVGLSLAALAFALSHGDMFGTVMAVMGFAIGWGIGTGIETESTREKLRRAEERTAVLAVAAERERIGRDLHDILGHSLTTIAVKADLAGRLVGRNDDAARAEVDSLASIARQALADVRATAANMREVRLASEIASARSVLDAAAIEHTTPTALPVLDDDRAELFGWVVREAITNVVRHSGASQCAITCTDHSVTVTDDGRGIDTKGDGRTGTPGSGLAGLRSRVEQTGGTLELASTPGRTSLTAILPSPSDSSPHPQEPA